MTDRVRPGKRGHGGTQETGETCIIGRRMPPGGTPGPTLDS